MVAPKCSLYADSDKSIQAWRHESVQQAMRLLKVAYIALALRQIQHVHCSCTQGGVGSIYLCLPGLCPSLGLANPGE